MFSYSNENEVKRSSNQIYHEYFQGALNYLDLENEKDSDLIQQIRQYFARFIYKFINQIPRNYILLRIDFDFLSLIDNRLDNIRETIIPLQIRYNLFELFRKWSGNFNIMSVFAPTK